MSRWRHHMMRDWVEYGKRRIPISFVVDQNVPVCLMTSSINARRRKNNCNRIHSAYRKHRRVMK